MSETNVMDVPERVRSASPPASGADPDGTAGATIRATLRRHIEHTCRVEYGVTDPRWLDHVADTWADHRRNYNGRYRVIASLAPDARRILDMAAGVGTFLLHILDHGLDAWGVEPEAWKRSLFAEMVARAGRPVQDAGRLVDAVGEALPFDDASFDLVTTYQTLEHVSDVDGCVAEMLRVLRPGGVLYLKAPDYRCLFEPHYRLPFLPCMNRRLAAAYLRALGRPPRGLDTLNWTTAPAVRRALRATGHPLRIERLPRLAFLRRVDRIAPLLPAWARHDIVVTALNHLYELRFSVPRLARVMSARQERNIDLWITKDPGAVP